MKKTLILIFFYNLLQGQVSGYVEYDYTVAHSIIYTTKSVLKFNSDKSVFTTFNVESKKSKEPKLLSTEGGNYNYLVEDDSRQKPVFFVDKKNNMLITKARAFKENYILTETIPVIKWEIRDEFKTLSELRCQKAVGYFRGRTYTVWFTEAIPLSFGPWKLQGLPGLILEAKDATERFFYRATKIKLNTNDTIDLLDLSKAIPLKTFITKIAPTRTEEIISKIQSKSDRNTTIMYGGIDRLSVKEIIYEWEEQKNED